MSRVRALPFVACTVFLAGCAATDTRPAASTLGCAEAGVAQLPEGLSDTEQHCLASALIARQCSPFEAWLAGWGKELRDAFGGGQASRADLRANQAGRRCASESGDPGLLLACCRRD
jgi:hypothetical protein